MQFIPSRISGVVMVAPDVFADDRGEFAIAWVRDEFAQHGLDVTIAQANQVLNRKRGSIRGMHYQAAPFEEAKVIRVTRGAIFDVAVDLRSESPTYLQWVGYELSARDRRMVYVPPGCAHGYQTLEDDTEVFYFVSAPYTPTHQRGMRWDDPAFGIDWRLGPPTRISDRDATFPYFERPASR